MCNKFISIFVLSVLLLITGCSSNTAKEDTITTNLKIATIGAPPSLNADQVKFENIQLENLKKTTDNISGNYNAVFIMPEFLSPASADKYISAYEELKIPIFFIESKKDELPFINEDVSYENAPVVNSSNNFATGYLNKSSNQKEVSYVIWKYQLSKNVNKKDAIQKVYTQIFETISDVQLEK